MSSPFIIKEATTRAEIDAIAEMNWKSFYTPYQPMFSALNPVLGPTEADRKAAIEVTKESYWKMHLGEGSNWVMAIDPETSEVAAGCQWVFHTKNPYPDGYVPEKIVAANWPEGSPERELASKLLRQVYKPRQTWVQKPVACKFAGLVSFESLVSY